MNLKISFPAPFFIPLAILCVVSACKKDDSPTLGDTDNETGEEIVPTHPERNDFIITSLNRKLLTVDTDTGEQTEIYEFTEGLLNDVNNMAHFENGIAYVVTDRNAINAVNIDSRQLLWETPIVYFESDTELRPAVVCDEGICYAAGHNGAVVGVDQSSGEEIWRYSMRKDGEFKNYMGAEGTPMVKGDRLYIISRGSFGQDVPAILHVLDKKTGEAIKKLELPSNNASTPKVLENVILIPAGNLYAVDIETNEIRWTFEADGVGTPYISNGKLVLQAIKAEDDSKSALYCLDPETGNLLWQVDTGFDVLFHPVIVGDVVFAVYQEAPFTAFEENGRPFAVKLSDGGPLWSNDKLSVDTSPVFANGRLFFLGYTIGKDHDTHSGLACVDANTGEVVWYSPKLRDDFSVPPVVVADNGVFGPSYYHGR